MKRILGGFFCIATSLGAVTPNYDQIQHQVSNHDAEIRMLEAKGASQEAMIADLERRLRQAEQAANRGGGGASTPTLERLAQEVQKLQTHAQEMTAAFKKYQNLALQLEAELAETRSNHEHLQVALSAVLESLDMPSTPKTYAVRAGDSLGKIANEQKTTIRELKRLNQLSSDKINVGQELKLPS